jgi:hypothetical protein
MHYDYNAYLNENILDTLTTDDNNQSSSERVASTIKDDSKKNIRITFAFSLEKYSLQDIEPYEKMFDSLCQQFMNSRFIKSFNTWNVSWDNLEVRDRTFDLENHSIEADKNYSTFLKTAYKKSQRSSFDKISIINRFNIEPIQERYPFKKFCREVYQWYRILVRANRGLYDNLNVLITRTDISELFAILFKGTSMNLNQRDLESGYRKIWPETPANKSLMNSNDFNMKYGQKELFEFRTFLKYLHGRSNMFPGVDIYVRGDGTWKSVKENSSYSDLESWNIYLKINNFADPKKHNTNAAIDFVKRNIYSHFGPGDRYMLMNQVKANHVAHMSVKFMICIPTEWKDSKDSTLFFDQEIIDIPRKMQFYNGPEKIPVEFIIECANPNAYGAEVIIDEDGEWSNRHISWLLIGNISR